MAKQRFRVYYNKSADYPFVWSFDKGSSDTEQTVMELRGERFESAYTSDGDNVNTPRAFFWVTADEVVIRNGIAYFVSFNGE
jgi:hypothetical protein